MLLQGTHNYEWHISTKNVTLKVSNATESWLKVSVTSGKVIWILIFCKSVPTRIDLFAQEIIGLRMNRTLNYAAANMLIPF